MKLLLYCTKAKPYLEYKQIPRTLMEFDNSFEGYRCSYKKTEDDENFQLNGKIVAECDFEVEEIFEDNLEDARDGYVEHFYTLKSYDDFDEGENVLLKESCLQKHELSNYLGFENGYAIHIKNLHIFDEPRDTREYNTYNRYGKVHIADIPIRKAPQNMMYAFDYYGNPFVLISIKPERLCKILNGEKTIEVRRNVLKEMLE